MFDKKRGDNPVRSSRLRMLSFSAVAALALYPALSPTIAAETDANQAAAIQAPASQAPATPAAASTATGDQAPLVTGALPPARSPFLPLGVGKSVVAGLPRGGHAAVGA